MTLVTKPRRLALWSAALIALLFGVNASTANGEEGQGGREPGLPFIDCIGYPSTPCFGPDDMNDYGWTNTAQVGLAGSTKALQWTRIPLTMMATATEFGFDFYDGPWFSNQTIDLRVRAFFTSPVDSGSNYGDSALIPVQTVAFGTIPTEITLQITQDRDAAGDPVPLGFVDRTRTIVFPEDRPDLSEVRLIEDLLEPLQATVEVRVVSLKLDGVDVALKSGCSTGPSAELNLTNRPARAERPVGQEGPDPLLAVTHPDTHFLSANGGSLFGTIDIPAFSGCISGTGDNISPIVTSAISGDENPVQAKVGLISCVIVGSDGRTAPNPPGVVSPYDPRSGCNTDLAQGPYTAVPTPLAFPDYAPGAAPAP